MAEQGIKTDDNIAKVSVVGVGMRSHAGVALRTFEILAREGINILMISTSEIKISVVVEAKYAELAVRVLHDGFESRQARRCSFSLARTQLFSRATKTVP